MRTGGGGRTIFLLCQLSSVTHTNLLTSLDRVVQTDLILISSEAMEVVSLGAQF